jgi:hypothetical protein
MTPRLPAERIPPGPWRRRRRGGRISSKRCPLCGTALHQELADRGIRTHPTCDPNGD